MGYFAATRSGRQKALLERQCMNLTEWFFGLRDCVPRLITPDTTGCVTPMGYFA